MEKDESKHPIVFEREQVPGYARFVVLNDVSVTFDGSEPSSTLGHKMFRGERITWADATFEKAKMISL